MISSDADRASVIARLRTRRMMPAGASDMGFVPSPEMIAAALQIVQASGIFGPNPQKEAYKKVKPEFVKLANAYGPNIIAASSAVQGLDPNEVASAVSDYLKPKGVNLTPQQVLSMDTSPKGGASSNMLLPLLLVGAAGVYYMSQR